MAIKKVVDKPKAKTVKKLPEFDSSKLYITDDLLKVIRDDEGDYQVIPLTNELYEFKTFDTFYDLLEEYKLFRIEGTDLARFIMGCREFPKVEEIEETTPLAEDEVSIEDVSESNIYAYYSCTTVRRYFDSIKGFQFLCDSGIWQTERKAPTLQRSIEDALKDKSLIVYEFSGKNKEEEYLRWSLEQITGKKFRPACHVIRHVSVAEARVEVFA